MSASPASVLRERARTLRTLADRLQESEVLGLAPLADVATWMGPSPSRCHDALVTMRRRLLAEADELRRAAARCERSADVLALAAPAGLAR